MNLVTSKQARDLIQSINKRIPFQIFPTKTQRGGFLGTLLASIGILMAVDLVKNSIFGKGAPEIGSKTDGGAAPQIGFPKFPPPFYSYPPYVFEFWCRC